MAEQFNLGDVVVGTEVDLDGLKEGLDEAEKEVEKKAPKIGETASKAISTGMAGLAAVIGGTLVAGLMDVSAKADQARVALQDVADRVDFSSLIENATILEARFGTDLQSILGATRTLMTEFGLTGDEAMAVITAGFERGLDTSGDFLDSIGEYSNLFAENGATAEEFFSLLDTGLAGGALGTDKAADAFKEFGIRIRETSDEVFGPNGTLRGMMSDREIEALLDGMRKGTLSVADAYRILVPRIKALNDPIEQNRIGISLFGTQWEDLGASAVLAIDLTSTSMQDIDDAADSSRARLSSLGEIFPRLWGGFQSALLPANDAMLAFINDALIPGIEQFRLFLDEVIAAVQPILAMAQAIAQKLEPMVELLRDGMRQLMTAMRPVVQFIEENLTAVILGLSVTIGILITAALVPLIATLWATATAAAAAALATAVALAPIIAVAAAIGAAVALLYTAWTENWFGIQDVTETVLTELSAFITATWNAIETFFTEILPKIATIITDGWNGINTAVETTIAAISSAITTTWTAIQTSVKQTIDTISSNIAEVWTAIQTSVKQKVDTIWSDVTTVWTNIKNGVSGSATDAKSAVVEQFEAMRDALKSGGTLATQIGDNAKAIGSDIIAKVQDAWQGLTGDNSLAGRFFTFVNSSLDKVKSDISANGLQTTLTNLAKELVAKIDAGITGLSGQDSLLGRITKAFVDTFDSLKTISGTFLANVQAFAQQMVTEIIKTFTASGTGLYQNLWNGISIAWLTLIDNAKSGTIFDRMVDFAKNMVTAVFDRFTETSTGIYQKLWDGIKAAWDTLVTNAQGGNTLFDALGLFASNMLTRLKDQFIGDNSTFGFYHMMWNAIWNGWNRLIGALTSREQFSLGGAILDFAVAMIEKIKSSFSWNSIGQWLIDLFTHWARTWFTGGQPSGASMVDGVSQSQSLGMGSMTTSSTTYNLTAQYGYQPERALRDDIRLLQLIQSTS